jgi:transposase
MSNSSKNCSNCGAAITCGCQERVASNGKLVCSNCISSYEEQLEAMKKIQSNALPTKPNKV